MRYSVSILGRGGRDRMVVGFTTTCAISAYPRQSCEVEPCSWQGVLDTTLCDKVCQWFAAGRWFSPGIQVFTTNKTDRHNITEILLKVALNTITLNLSYLRETIKVTSLVIWITMYFWAIIQECMIITHLFTILLLYKEQIFCIIDDLLIFLLIFTHDNIYIWNNMKQARPW
jgi:hypothetical protein